MMAKKGFTLLEIIIVIIIIGVLASLALPRLFRTIEYSRSAEALAAMATIRNAVERCYLMNNGSVGGCIAGSNQPQTFIEQLGIEDPALSPNAHFTYGMGIWNAPNLQVYSIRAYRNSRDGGSGDNTDALKLEVRLNGPQKGVYTCGRPGGIWENFGTGCLDNNW